MPRRRVRSLRVEHVDRAQIHSEPWRHGLHDGEMANPGAYGGIPKGRCACHARRNLLEQFTHFPLKLYSKIQKADGITARPRQAVDEASADRISDTAEHKSEWCGSPPTTVPRPQRRLPGLRPAQARPVRPRIGESRGHPPGPAGLDPHVATFSPG